jgi:MFS family permease
MARLAALWFGLQFVWGAILAVSLQARSVALVPGNGLHAYAQLAAIGAIVGTCVQLAAGPLADRAFARTGHRRGFYAAGVVVVVPALAWFYLAPSYPSLLAAFLLLQVGMNIAIGPYQAIVPDYVAAKHTGAASSWMGIFQPLGNACGLLVAGFLNNLALVAAIIALTLVVSLLITERRVRGLVPEPGAHAEPLRLTRDFRTLIASRTAINFGFYTLLGFLFFFVGQSLGVRADDVRLQTALLFLTFTIANVVGAVLAARPADRYDKRAVVAVANVGIVIGLAVLAFAPTLALAFVASAIAGIAWGAYFIADWALACTLLPRGGMAAAMGIWNIAAAIPQIVAPVFTEPIIARANAYTFGLGPRVAVLLAIVEFTIGTIWLYRLRPSTAIAQPSA